MLRVCGIAVALLGVATLAGGESRAGETPAKPGTLYLRDGTTIEGEVSEAPGGMYVVRPRPGVELRVGKERVLQVEYREEFELELSRRSKELGPNDVKERVELARFCLAHRRPERAQELLEEALMLAPGNTEVSDLLKAARAQAELAKREAAGGTVASAPPVPRRPVTTTQPARDDSQANMPGVLLDPEQINFVKQMEFRRGEAGVNFRFENDVERRYSAATGISMTALRQLTPGERFWTIRHDPVVGAELGKEIRVLRDPTAVRVFRSSVQRVVLAGCATAGCHATPPVTGGMAMPLGAGGAASADDGGTGSAADGDPAARARFALVVPAETEAATYTNFYRIVTGQVWVELPSGRRALRPLVDRQSPESSLLLQFSLPSELATTPHPRVTAPAMPGKDGQVLAVRPMFRSMQDARYLEIRDWIENTLSPVEPNYSQFPAGKDAAGKDAAGKDAPGKDAPGKPAATQADGTAGKK